jgi:hypothetical protein
VPGHARVSGAIGRMRRVSGRWWRRRRRLTSLGRKARVIVSARRQPGGHGVSSSPLRDRLRGARRKCMMARHE